VTGIAKKGKEKFITDSIAKVRSVILSKYGIDIAQEYFTHIDFAQAYGVDGPQRRSDNGYSIMLADRGKANKARCSSDRRNKHRSRRYNTGYCRGQGSREN